MTKKHVPSQVNMKSFNLKGRDITLRNNYLNSYGWFFLNEKVLPSKYHFLTMELTF